MNCEKCQNNFNVDSKISNLYAMSEYDELVEKYSDLLQKLNINFELLDGIIKIHNINPKEFFSFNLDAFNNYFNEYEKKDIKVFLENENNKFTYHSILKAKPLIRYLSFFNDKDFFEIIENESLTSYFQPIVDIKHENIYGYETLVRGVKNDGSLMYPDELFSKSKINDYTFKLDRLCRESALKTAATKKVNQKVFINFIPTSIYDPEYCLQSTLKWANQLEFDYSNIVFEVVETEKVKNQEHLKNILKYYREKGFKIALDDVGEGYSSLNMLIDLRPDIIKIDRNIITNIDKDELKQSVYKALYNLSKDNGIEVLAEGVETKYELDVIKSIGVDYLQGYYFAKPNAEPIRVIDKYKFL